MAFDRQSPIGDERDDYMFAHVCLRIFQAAGIKKPSNYGMPGPVDPNAWQITDFRIFKPKEPEQTMTIRDFMRSRFAGRIVKKAA